MKGIISRLIGTADKCSNCGSTSNVQWANKSHEYNRKLDDWIKLCRKCHCEYDKDNLGIASKMYASSSGGLGVRL